MSRKNGAAWYEALLSAGVAGIASAFSISNLVGFTGDQLDLALNAFVDLIFGTGGNGIAAGTYKAITQNAQRRNESDLQDIPTGKNNTPSKSLPSQGLRFDMHYVMAQ